MAAQPGRREKLAGPMNLAWLPVSDDGPMVADYIGVSYVNGNPFGVFAVAQAPSGSTLEESMYTTKSPLPAAGSAERFSGAADKPVPDAKSDHEMHFFYDDEGRRKFRARAGSRIRPRSRSKLNAKSSLLYRILHMNLASLLALYLYSNFHTHLQQIKIRAGTAELRSSNS